MSDIKEKCIKILINYILDRHSELPQYNWSEADDVTYDEMLYAENKIVEIANTTDKRKLEEIYEEIKDFPHSAILPLQCIS